LASGLGEVIQATWRWRRRRRSIIRRRLSWLENIFHKNFDALDLGPASSPEGRNHFIISVTDHAREHQVKSSSPEELGSHSPTISIAGVVW
jgi:hypothetical protein